MSLLSFLDPFQGGRELFGDNDDDKNKTATPPPPPINYKYKQPPSGKNLAGITYRGTKLAKKINTNSLGKSGQKAYGDIKAVGAAFQNFLPGIFNSLAKVQTQQAPALTEHQLRMLKQFGPGFAAAEGDMANIGTMKSAQGQLDINKRILPELTAFNLGLSQEVDPEYYKTRSNVSGAAENLINSINPNGLTEGEMTLAERSQNRTNIGQGTQSTGSPSAGIKSALGFDNRLSAKRDQLNSVLGNVGSFMPNLKSGIFEGSSAQVNKNQGSGAGLGNFNNSTANSNSNASNLGGNLLNQAGAAVMNRTNIEANKVPQWQQTLGAVSGAIPDY